MTSLQPFNFVVGTAFSFYNEQDILKLSVKQIQSAVAFDDLGHPVPGGLYDPTLGPVEQSATCVTCFLPYKDCPGHLGHVVLSVPVYQPLLFNVMFRVLRAKCFCCHRLKLSSLHSRTARIKLMLIDVGLTREAMNLDDELLHKDGNLTETRQAGMARREAVLEKYENLAKSRQPVQLTGHSRECRRRVVDQFLRKLPASKCDNCGAQSPALRRDGFAKIFQNPLSAKAARSMKAKGLSISSALDTASSTQLRAAGIDAKAARGSGAEEHVPEGDEAVQDDALEDAEGFASDAERTDVDEEEEEEEGGGGGGGGGGGDSDLAAKGAKYLPPTEVEMHLRLLWEHDGPTIRLVWGSSLRTDWRQSASRAHSVEPSMFFLRVLPVAPSRFRPPTVLGEQTFEHPQNVMLTRVLNMNERLLQLDAVSVQRRSEAAQTARQAAQAAGASAAEAEAAAAEASNKVAREGLDLSRALTTWIQLQEAVNSLLDSSKAPTTMARDVPSGVRQLLEKKQGLFRKNMMGKRVNYAARSVISPDPNLHTDEIGVPLRFAKALCYPQPVTPWNVVQLRQMVLNGSDAYPGANYVEDEQGRLVDLSRRTPQQRVALSKTLMTRSAAGGAAGGVPAGACKRVWRHLLSGDALLVNRQPTLHKSSIMAHKARVLMSTGQVIRMHYANCNTYNADFDGDEINLHFPQNELARAEAYNIAATCHQYLTVKDGSPLRGLIQDHVGAGVLLTKRDTFLTREQYQQLVYIACADLSGAGNDRDVATLPPAMLRPRRLWTGRQVIETLLNHLTRDQPRLHLAAKTKIPSRIWVDKGSAVDEEMQDGHVLFSDNAMLRGVLDKSAFGASTHGLVHAVHELYGPHVAADLLTALGRLFTLFMQWSGHTCGIDDLVVMPEAEARRRALIVASPLRGIRTVAGFLGMDADRVAPAEAEAEAGAASEAVSAAVAQARERVRVELARQLRRDPGGQVAAALDNAMRGTLSPLSSEIINICLPGGQYKPFPANRFSLMVQSGAKGSMVNQSQISCGLGQQELEGRRVPSMVSGKTLPSFQAYDPSPRAGGYITDRFLTGIRPQEYYFHCMAGREGLVDTAVKTSRSGYLQRCLIKHLEDLQVQYDHTVRNSDGCIVQFVYGEDGTDVTNAKFLGGADDQLAFLARNHRTLTHKFRLTPDFFQRTGVDAAQAPARNQLLARARAALARPLEAAAEGDFVEARRVVEGAERWQFGRVTARMFPALVARVRRKEGKDGQAAVTLDLQFVGSDGQPRGAVVKRVPLRVSMPGGGGALPVVRRALPDPAVSTFTVGRHAGAISEKLQDRLTDFVHRNPQSLLGVPAADAADAAADAAAGAAEGAEARSSRKQRRARAAAAAAAAAAGRAGVTGAAFEVLFWLKYMRNLAHPGESVGTVAAQSIGEPSTQMTLNTFHLAGHGSVNVTLGIPRLREIVMTASANISTPMMELPLLQGQPKSAADAVAKQLYRLRLDELLAHKDGIRVVERMLPRGSKAHSLWSRVYRVRLQFASLDAIRRAFDVGMPDLQAAVSATFLPRLLAAIQMEIKRSGGGVSSRKARRSEEVADATGEEAPLAAPEGEEAAAEGADADEPAAEGGAAQPRARGGAMDPDEDGDGESAGEEDEDGDEAQGTLRFGRRADVVGYDDADEEDEAALGAGQEGGFDIDALGLRGRRRGGGGGGGGAGEEEAEEEAEEEGGGDAEAPAKGKPALPPSFATIPADLPAGTAYVSVRSSASRSPHFQGCYSNTEESWIEMRLEFPAATKKLLMVNLAEAAAAKVVVRAVEGIDKCVLSERSDGRPVVQTSGVNFKRVWELRDVIDTRQLSSNDVHALLKTYGVEAARKAITREINAVFSVYGISVDPRHLGLIADYMTQNGGYRAMNRTGMESHASPFLQMSFETTANFLTQAALSGGVDSADSPSSCIVLGQVFHGGTGAFELRQPLV